MEERLLLLCDLLLSFHKTSVVSFILFSSWTFLYPFCRWYFEVLFVFFVYVCRFFLFIWFCFMCQKQDMLMMIIKCPLINDHNILLLIYFAWSRLRRNIIFYLVHSGFTGSFICLFNQVDIIRNFFLILQHKWYICSTRMVNRRTTSCSIITSSCSTNSSDPDCKSSS